MICFAHISDTHVDQQAEAERNGGKPLRNLQRVLAEIAQHPTPIDFILHTGDICGGVSSPVGKPAAYQHIVDAMKQIDLPCFYVLGNHDDPQIAWQYLGQPEWLPLIVKDRWTYSFQWKRLLGIVLNARIDVKGNGRLSSQQLEALSQKLDQHTGPAIVALHFTPIVTGNIWNDQRMMLTNADDLHQVLLPFRHQLKGVFFGHIHRSFQRLRDGILYIAGPSTAYGIDFWPAEQRPHILHQRGCGWNWVSVLESGVEVRTIQWDKEK